MILVTGASGFIGTHLVKALSADGKNVRALFNSRQPGAELSKLPGVEWMKCDLLDVYAVEEVMQGIQDVYNCAAIVSFNRGDRDRLMHVNVESTANVVNEAVLQEVRKLVHLSSVAALGRSNRERKEITEEEPWEESRRNSMYGQSKYAAELEAWRGAGEGLSVAVVNPGIVLGEDLRHGNDAWDEGSARLFKVVDDEFPFYTEGINGWVDVQDVVRAMMLLMDSEVEDERFILSAGNFSYREVFTKMAAALGRKPPRIKAARWMTGLVWRWNRLKSIWGERSTVTKETARTARQQVFYENSKFLKAFPDFGYTPLEETLARAATAYRLAKAG
jgi:dihydroflavonol-4-reductase